MTNLINLQSDADLVVFSLINENNDLSEQMIAKYKSLFNLTPTHNSISGKKKKLKAEYEFSLRHNEMLSTKAKLFDLISQGLKAKNLCAKSFEETRDLFLDSVYAQAVFIEQLSLKINLSKKAA